MHDYYLVLYKFLLKWPNGYFIAPKARQKLYETKLCNFLFKITQLAALSSDAFFIKRGRFMKNQY